MSLWLYSSGDGESNAHADEHLLQAVGSKKARLTFVSSGTVGDSSADSEYYFQEFADRFRAHGYRNVAMLALDRPWLPQALERAVSSELIYLSGGNTFYFLDMLRRSGFGEVLRRRAEIQLPIAGHSAGAIVLTPTIRTASFPEDDRDDNDVGLTDLRALRLVDFECFPHYTSKVSYNREIRRSSLTMGRPIYALPDGSCVASDSGRLTFFGPVWAFVKGVRFKVR